MLRLQNDAVSGTICVFRFENIVPELNRISVKVGNRLGGSRSSAQLGSDRFHFFDAAGEGAAEAFADRCNYRFLHLVFNAERHDHAVADLKLGLSCQIVSAFFFGHKNRRSAPLPRYLCF